MVRKVFYILFFVSILANNFSCQMMNRSRYKNCNDIIITENIFSLIDNIEDFFYCNKFIKILLKSMKEEVII